MRPYKRKGKGSLSDLQYQQRLKNGFKADPRYSGEWTSLRIRTEHRDEIKKKFKSLKSAIEFLLTASIP